MDIFEAQGAHLLTAPGAKYQAAASCELVVKRGVTPIASGESVDATLDNTSAVGSLSVVVDYEAASALTAESHLDYGLVACANANVKAGAAGLVMSPVLLNGSQVVLAAYPAPVSMVVEFNSNICTPDANECTATCSSLPQGATTWADAPGVVNRAANTVTCAAASNAVVVVTVTETEKDGGSSVAVIVLFVELAVVALLIYAHKRKSSDVHLGSDTLPATGNARALEKYADATGGVGAGVGAGVGTGVGAGVAMPVQPLPVKTPVVDPETSVDATEQVVHVEAVPVVTPGTQGAGVDRGAAVAPLPQVPLGTASAAAPLAGQGRHSKLPPIAQSAPPIPPVVEDDPQAWPQPAPQPGAQPQAEVAGPVGLSSAVGRDASPTL